MEKMLLDDLQQKKKIGMKEQELKRHEVEIIDMEIHIKGHEDAIEHCLKRIQDLQSKIEECKEEIQILKDIKPMKKVYRGTED